MADYNPELDGDYPGPAGYDQNTDGIDDPDRYRRFHVDPAGFVSENRPAPYNDGRRSKKQLSESRSDGNDMGVNPTADAGPDSRHVAKGRVGNRLTTPRHADTPSAIRSDVWVQPDRPAGTGGSDGFGQPIPDSIGGGSSSSGRAMGGTIGGSDDSGAEGSGIEQRTTAISPTQATLILKRVGSWPEARRFGFEKAVFEAALGSIRFGASGELLITIVVPTASDIDQALKLREGFGLTLQFGVYRKRYAKIHGEEIDHG